MRKRPMLILILIPMMLLMMTGCTRSATRAPQTTMDEGGIPFPESNQSQILEDILAATQTAKAQELSASTEEPTGVSAASGGELTQAAAAQPTAVPQEQAKPSSFPTATPGVPATYTIQQDEYPFCIARRFNLNAGDLLAINGLNMDSYVVPGFVLTLPQNSSFVGERARRSHPTEYTVQAGDTIGKIACSFGDVNPYDIYAVNGLEQGSALTVGQVLRIP